MGKNRMGDTEDIKDGGSRAANECPQCGTEGIENPVLDDEYECSRCVIAFNSEGEVTARE